MLIDLATAVALCAVAACGTTDTASRPAGTDSLVGPLGVYKVGQPYRVNGRLYVPAVDYDYDETGTASWYGPGFQGKPTANGEVFDANALTAAHATLPMPSLVRVTNLDNGRSITLRVNDRGPFSSSRIIDVTRRGAQLLGFEKRGTARVRVQILEEESRQLAALAQGSGSPDDLQLAEEHSPYVAAVATTDTAPQATPVRTVVSPSSAARRAVPVDGGSDVWVQAGAFGEFANAVRLANQLKPVGAVRIQEAPGHQGQTFYRVQLGPLAALPDAATLVQDLQARGYQGAHVVLQ